MPGRTKIKLPTPGLETKNLLYQIDKALVSC